MTDGSNMPVTEVIDLADVIRSVRNGWKTVVACTVLGAAASVGVLAFVPPLFEGDASVVLKTGSSAGNASSLAVAMGALAGAGGEGGAGGALAGLKSGVETEVEILQSRTLAGMVVDSLDLQTMIVRPRATPPSWIVASANLGGSFKPRMYTFAQLPDTTGGRKFSFRSKSDTGVAVAGSPATLAIGTVTLSPPAGLTDFQIVFWDREDAITNVIDHLDVDKPKGDVAHMTYRGRDSLTAARVLNVLLDLYLVRRKGIDRGINQRRAEFLAAKVDSVGLALVSAERQLRAQRESTGIIDPLAVGKLEMENASKLRTQLTEIQVRDSALKQLVAQIKSGTSTPRQLAAYPQYIGNGAIITIVSTLIGVESERQSALETVTPEDRSVKALTERAKALENQLLPMAMTTLNALASERASVEARLANIQTSLLGVPRAAESYGRLEREILDRGSIYAGLQTQLVDARLAAITEGGDVRTLDQAAVPKRVAFPKRPSTLATGIGGGLFIGVLTAALLGLVGSLHDAHDVERRMGLPAVRFETSSPLLVGGQASRTILVAPINGRANAKPVAERLVETAVSRSRSATVLDLSDQGMIASALPASGDAKLLSSKVGSVNRFDANAAIARLEETHDLVVVHLPELASHAAGAVLSSARPVLLVAPERRIERNDLQSAVDLLRRVGSPCAGVVLHGDDRRSLRS